VETEQAQPPDKIPDLLKFERFLMGTVIAGAFLVGSLGLASSFETVGNAAREWGFHPFWVLPVAIDVAVPVFSLAHLLLIRADMPLGWVRAVPWGLTGVTIYLNIEAAGSSVASKIGHAALPLLWVICSEIAAHVYRSLIGAVTGRRMERVRKSRWLLAPFSTAGLWRRMVLWEVTSYRTALVLESKRLMARADLRDVHGRGWRRKVSRRQLVQLRLGEMEPAVELEQPVVQVPVQTVPELERVSGSVPRTGTGRHRSQAVERRVEQVEQAVEPAPVPVQVPLEQPVEPEVELEQVQVPLEQPVELERGTDLEQVEPGLEPVELTGRASTKNSQVRAVLELMEQVGTSDVSTTVIVEQTGMPKTTAYRRLKDAQKEWNAGRRTWNGGTGTAQTGT
jgi:hypothetical protein